MVNLKNDLLKIPGVGKSISKDLDDLGISKIEDLKNKDPEILYANLCKIRGVKQDICLLYVFRCAVAYSKMAGKNRENLKWWDFKDDKVDKH
jgi:hypothetical protein